MVSVPALPLLLAALLLLPASRRRALALAQFAPVPALLLALVQWGGSLPSVGVPSPR